MLRAKRLDEALKLCLDGIERYPDYTTGHLLAARCLAQKGEYESALHHVNFSLQSMPGNAILLAYRNNWRELKRVLKERSRSQPQLISTAANKPSELTTKQKSQDRVVPHDESLTTQENPVDAALIDSPIVSVTLAEIYTMQGAHEAAIAMYRKLQKQKPQQAQQFEIKIQELLGKIRQQP